MKESTVSIWWRISESCEFHFTVGMTALMTHLHHCSQAINQEARLVYPGDSCFKLMSLLSLFFPATMRFHAFLHCEHHASRRTGWQGELCCQRRRSQDKPTERCQFDCEIWINVSRISFLITSWRCFFSSLSFSLLGPSGCGKTTLLRCLVGLIKPSQGRVRVCGYDPHSSKFDKSLVGFMPQELALYDEFTAIETLRYFGLLYCMNKFQLEYSIENLVTFLDLTHCQDQKVDTLRYERCSSDHLTWWVTFYSHP